MTKPPESWGRYPRATPAAIQRLSDRNAPLPPSRHPLLVYGNGRSYGDVCLNDGGTVLLARGLDRFIAFDAATGVLRAEAGVLLSEILDLGVPRGWFLPVTPGTRFVTLGGAVANDVHGKNHHRAGTFGLPCAGARTGAFGRRVAGSARRPNIPTGSPRLSAVWG
jgi:FAD/FMN-containing dehydrogenase